MCQRITPSWQEHANIIAIEGVHHSSCCDPINPPAATELMFRIAREHITIEEPPWKRPQIEDENA